MLTIIAHIIFWPALIWNMVFWPIAFTQGFNRRNLWSDLKASLSLALLLSLSLAYIFSVFSENNS